MRRRAGRPAWAGKAAQTHRERSRIVALVGTTPPGRPVIDPWFDGLAAAEDETKPAVWTLNSLTEAARAAGIDVHRSQIRRILLSEGVRWRRPRSWTTSKDPQFAAKERGSWTFTRTRPRVR